VEKKLSFMEKHVGVLLLAVGLAVLAALVSFVFLPLYESTVLMLLAFFAVIVFSGAWYLPVIKKPGLVILLLTLADASVAGFIVFLVSSSGISAEMFVVVVVFVVILFACLVVPLGLFGNKNAEGVFKHAFKALAAEIKGDYSERWSTLTVQGKYKGKNIEISTTFYPPFDIISTFPYNQDFYVKTGERMGFFEIKGLLRKEDAKEILEKIDLFASSKKIGEGGKVTLKKELNIPVKTHDELEKEKRLALLTVVFLIVLFLAVFILFGMLFGFPAG
jgi:hypothetical protein